MKHWILPALVIVAIATGCNGNKKSTTMTAGAAPRNAASLDIPASAPPAQYTPPPQPVVYDTAQVQQPVVSESADTSYDAPAPRASRRTSSSVSSAMNARSSAAGTKYKIKKGESLWSIAQTRYGNGNKWKQIAAANPGLNPNKVQAGQVIVLP